MTALHQNKLPQIIKRSGPIMRSFQSVAGAKMSCSGNIGQYEKSMPPRKQIKVKLSSVKISLKIK